MKKDNTAVDKKEEQAPSKMKEIIDFLLPIVIALIIALLLKHFVFANAVVPTGSMLNTIQEGDRVIASRIEYKFSEPQRYDIVIFEYPDDESQYFVKRLIGLPGETINIRDGVVFVTDKDGKTKELRSDFVSPENADFYNGSFQVPEDSYFFLGDNRAHSVDSRYWNTTNFVKKDKLVGKVKFRYFPFNTFGKLD